MGPSGVSGRQNRFMLTESFEVGVPADLELPYTNRPSSLARLELTSCRGLHLRYLCREATAVWGWWLPLVDSSLPQTH